MVYLERILKKKNFFIYFSLEQQALKMPPILGEGK
jgi:hypothetical protein